MSAKTKRESTTRGGPKALAALAAKATKPLLGKRGFIEVDILTNWRAIVGDELAEHTAPERIAFQKGRRDNGVLHIRAVSSAFAAELQHRSNTVVSRVNTFFGYAAVARIRIHQGGLPRPEPVTPVLPPEADEETKRTIEDMSADVKDEEIRSTLKRLGAHVMAGKKD